jgi:signal transduction histidine kinase
MRRALVIVLGFLPRALSQRLPLLVIAAYLTGAVVVAWTMNGLYNRNLAIAYAETSGEVLQSLLNKNTWQNLSDGGSTSTGGFILQRHAQLNGDLPSHTVPLILTIGNERLRAAVAFETPPKLPGALRAPVDTRTAAERLANLSRGIARQDQAAQLHVFIQDGVVLSVSSPTVWQARPGQTTIALTGFTVFTIGLSLIVALSLNMATPFGKLAERGPVSGGFDPLASNEAVLIKDKIDRLTDRFRIEQETKERNLAAISHDLRTPITRLRLRTELIGDTPLHDRFEADLDEVSTIIDGALDLLSLRSQPEENLYFSLASLLESLVNDYSDTGKNVELVSPEEVELQSAKSIFSSGKEVTVRTDNACMICGQPDKLRRAFSNLIDNALKYGGRAVVEVKPVSQDMISVAIRDFGPGIDPNQIEHVQMPFVRGRTNHPERGVGLGLSIAHELIELHGGTLEFTNLDPGLLVTALVSRGS